MKDNTVYLFFCLLLICSLAHSQSPIELSPHLKKSQTDTNYVCALINSGKEHCKINGGYDNNSIKKSIPYFKQALELSKNLNDTKLLNEARMGLGDCYFRLNNQAKGKEYYQQVIDYYHNKGLLNQEANAWFRFASTAPAKNNSQDELVLIYFERALSLYKKANNTMATINTMNRIGYIFVFLGRLDLAEQELLAVLTSYKKIGYKKLYPVYDNLSRVYKTKGDLSKQLFYLLQMINNYDTYGIKSDRGQADYYYYIIGGFYRDWGMYDKALTWSKRAVDSMLTNSYDDVRQVVEILQLQKKNGEALYFLKTRIKNHPPVSEANMSIANQGLGDCYVALGQLEKAKFCYLNALAEYNSFMKDGPYYSSYEDVWMHQKLGDYYFKTGNFKKSAFYFAELDSLPRNSVKPAMMRSLYLSMFHTDSALHDYVPAIRHYQLYKKISDSLFNISKSGQIADMQIKYETDQKEQSIQLLESESKNQHVELKSLNLERNITLAGIAMLLVTGIIAYRGYQIKQRSNMQLQAKQQEINRQNFALQQLVKEKDGLLVEKDILLHDKDNLISEKDWLLKEVHHRVKNNLQIVTSLLNTQSAFLKNDDAINAIRESQTRVQSISLIHQKLYGSENTASVNMRSYISDLLLYLADCFGTAKHRIRFEQMVEDINIDISQAVPLGLILNEAITNAIKYAFGPAGGDIVIEFQRIGGDSLMLTVTDNGKGIPAEIINKERNSLGMKMMQILSKQLGGTYHIKNTSGVTIILEFPEEKLAHSIFRGNLDQN